MFHFRCAICAATPERILLRDYLHEWSAPSPERLHSLLCVLSGAVAEVCSGQARWLTKKFHKAADSLQRAINALAFDPPLMPDSSLHAFSSSALHFRGECPMCRTQAGPRKPDIYFSDWPHACKVQTGNLLYESALTIWAILVGLPSWASGGFLQLLNDVRGELHRTGQSMSLLECPQCGRFTTCRYGSEQDGFCRWCFDMGGGLGLAFSINPDPGGPLIKKMKPDYSAPAKSVWDILPPEVTERIFE